MSQFVRSGRPQHINGTTGVATVEKWDITNGPTMHFQISNMDAATNLELFLTKVAADLGAGNGIIVGPGMSFWGPYEIREFWTLAAGAVNFRATAACRP